MKKILIIIICLTLLSGCSNRAEEGTSLGSGEIELSRELPSSRTASLVPERASAEESKQQESKTVAMERGDTQRFTWYFYDSNLESYTASVEETSDSFTMAEVIGNVGQRLNLSPKVEDVQRQKDMVTISFSHDTENGADKNSEIAFLNSLVMTILENDINAEWITFQTDGGAYKTRHFSFPLGEKYEPAPLKIGGGDEDEYTALRQTIPYPGPVDFKQWLPLDYMAGKDDVAERLCYYLYLFGNPMREVASPSALPPEFIIERGLWVTHLMDSGYPDGEFYYPELRPVTAAVQDEQIYLKEHVEASVRLIFGDVSVSHQSVGAYVWHEAEGVYTPPHMGMGGGWIPILFSYENVEGVYTVDFAFVGMGPDAVFDEDGQAVPFEDVKEYALTRRHIRAVIGDGNDGNIILHGMNYLS